MTAREMVRKQDIEQLKRLRKTAAAERGKDPDFDSDLAQMIWRLESKLGIR